MPTRDEILELIDRYAAAVTGRDPAAVAACFTEDAVQRDPANNPPNVGRQAIEAFFQNAVGASVATDFEVGTVHTAGDNVAFDFTITVTLEAGTMVIKGIDAFTVSEDGRIGSATAYWDDADISFGAG